MNSWTGMKLIFMHDSLSPTSYSSVLWAGHASDANTHSPPRGLQFILGTKKKPDLFDTIVMANLVSMKV